MEILTDQPERSDKPISPTNGVAVSKHGISSDTPAAGSPEGPPTKKMKADEPAGVTKRPDDDPQKRKRGEAPVKPEYIVTLAAKDQYTIVYDDDAAEAARHEEYDDGKKGGKKKKEKGQNKARRFGRSDDEKGLCGSRAFSPELSPEKCRFGEECRFEHDLRTYLREYKRKDLTTFNSLCPVYEAKGKCNVGWRCRFVGSHMEERETEDGKKELILTEDEERKKKVRPLVPYATEDGIVNSVSSDDKISLARRKTQTRRADEYSRWLEKMGKEVDKVHSGRCEDGGEETNEDNGQVRARKEENRARFTDPPFLPSEKRRIYFGPETPALAPLTTQGNLPFRRLCIEFGAQFTYSEMAMSTPLFQGSKSEWALMKAHESEMLPPAFDPKANVVEGYDNSKDFKFGAQISSNKIWQAVKATEVLARFSPHLRVIDMNCGCPIDLVYRDGGGSALLENVSKLERMIRGMNAVSGEIPITAKIRMGVKDNAPNALKNIQRLVLGGYMSTVLDIGPPGTAAITLHGRSRQQRYTRQADWGYISECSALIRRLNEKKDAVIDTIREPDERMLPNGGRVYFLGNGDCYSHQDYNDHIENAGVDTVMVARGALIKPWIFEEIQTGQYLDKSASERLSHIEKFVRYGLEAWGSDEHGVGTTRRFLLEWLNFTHRYVPIGLLEYLPPNIQDRPPVWRGRNDLETLLGSGNYRDWIKISEMFLGPAHKDFKFKPKHRSNAYEPEG